MVTEVRRRGRPGKTEKVQQKGTQALERGITVLQYLAQSGGSASVTVIGERLDLPLSTTFRILKTLENAGFIYQDTQLGLWNIGLELFRVGSAYLLSHDMVSIARPLMRRLMILSGETVNLAIYSEGEAVLINQCECQSMVRMCAPLGNRLPLHASGAGKALLYTLEEDEVLNLVMHKGLQTFTPHTLVNFGDLRRDLIESLNRGYVIDREEHALGLNCIASAIFDQNKNVIAAVSLSGPTARVTIERFDSLGKLVKETAENISRGLGYQE